MPPHSEMNDTSITTSAPSEVISSSMHNGKRRNSSSSSSSSMIIPPDHFVCPLTLDVMMIPITDRGGRTYECAAIFEWIKIHGSCPLTREPRGPSDYIRNTPLRREIEEWRELYQYDHNHTNTNDSEECKQEEEDDDMLLCIGSSPLPFMQAMAAMQASPQTHQYSEMAAFGAMNYRERSEIRNTVRTLMMQQQEQDRQHLSTHNNNSSNVITPTSSPMTKRRPFAKLFRRQKR